MSGQSAGTSPPSTSGRTSAMKPVGQQPGLVIRVRGRDRGALAVRHLGKAIGPARRDPVRGRGVDHLDAVALDQRHRLARRVVGQAEDHSVGAVQQLAARLGVLAPRRVDRDDLQVAPAGQPLADLRPVVPASPSMNTLGAMVASSHTSQNEKGASVEPEAPFANREWFARV